MECKQIMQTLLGESEAWKNHPAVKMWRGSLKGLWDYAYAVNVEYQKRFDKRLPHKSFQQMDNMYRQHIIPINDRGLPKWLGDERLHSSHRANLVRKDPKRYLALGFTEAPQEGYFWPSANGY